MASESHAAAENLGGDAVHHAPGTGKLADDAAAEEEEVNSLQATESRRAALEKSLVRKLDLTLMPMLWFMYLFNYLDRNNIGQAKLSSLEEDLNLGPNEFNVAVSILNVGYMLMQLPSNMILTRARPSIYIPCWAALWSCISASTASARSFGHLVAIRFFLGFAEAPFSPGAVYLLSCWYTRRELAMRTAVLISGLPIATAMSGLIAAGVLSGLERARGIAGWQWLFIIEGSGSFFVALIGLLVLPDFPGVNGGGLLSRRLLTDDEQRIAKERIRRDQVTLPADVSIWNGLMAAVRDARTWVFVLMLLANHSAYGFINFFPTIVKGFGLGNNVLTLLLTAPPYLVAALLSLGLAYSSDRRGERGYHISASQAIGCAGFILSAATESRPARYAAAFLYVAGSFASVPVVLSWASSSMSETPEKRACAVAIVNLLSQVGNICSPYFFRPQDEPRYLMADLLMMAFSALVIVTCLVVKVLLKKANRRLVESGEGRVLFIL